MDDLRLNVLFNSYSVISGRWEFNIERLCAMCNGAPFTVQKISPRAGLELGPLDQ